MVSNPASETTFTVDSSGVSGTDRSVAMLTCGSGLLSLHLLPPADGSSDRSGSGLWERLVDALTRRKLARWWQACKSECLTTSVCYSQTATGRNTDRHVVSSANWGRVQSVCSVFLAAGLLFMPCDWHVRITLYLCRSTPWVYQ